MSFQLLSRKSVDSLSPNYLRTFQSKFRARTQSTSFSSPLPHLCVIPDNKRSILLPSLNPALNPSLKHNTFHALIALFINNILQPPRHPGSSAGRRAYQSLLANPHQPNTLTHTDRSKKSQSQCLRHGSGHRPPLWWCKESVREG